MMKGWAGKSMREASDLLVRVGRSELAADLNRIRMRVNFDELDVLHCMATESVADAVLEAESLHALTELLRELSRTMGLSHCTVHVVSESASTNFSTKVLTTYPEEWAAHYIARRYFAVDPISPACMETDNGFFWDRFDRNSPLLRSFWEDAAEYGIGPSGYTVPITTGRGDRIGFSVSASLDPLAFRDRFERYQDDFLTLGIYLTDSFCRLASDGRPSVFDPTDDQLRILRALAVGITEAELSEGRTEFYADLGRSICSLFQTRTVAQAAIIASRIGLLAGAPLTNADILATSDEIAVQAIVPPAGAPLRRLARLRSVATKCALPEPGGDFASQ